MARSKSGRSRRRTQIRHRQKRRMKALKARLKLGSQQPASETAVES